ncbi:MAG: DUF3108 domain-containing protein [Gemmatimonadota bacterium]
MRRWIPPLALALLQALPAAAQTQASYRGELAFKPGERLEYAVSYGPVPAGSMALEVVELTTYAGRPAYHFASEIESNRAVSYVYQIDSKEDAWLDAERLYSLRYKRESVENDRSHDRDYTFDQERHLRIEPDGDSLPASPRAVDQLSMIYYLRLLPYQAGARFTLRNQADPDDNPITVRVLKKERVKVPAGTFEAWVVELELVTDSGVFKKGGDNRIWLTADERHLPVKLSSKVGLGSFQAELVSYRPGQSVSAR